MRRILFYIFLLLQVVFSLPLPAKTVGFAPVRNFTRQTYGASSQNWAVSQDPLGRMFFANHDGLLRYDGIRWRLFRLPNYTTVRTVLADDKTGRVYVGGSGEFGYFESDPERHTTRYVSMVDQVPPPEREFAEIWHVQEIAEGRLAFQGDYKVFITENGRAEVFQISDKLTSSEVVGGILYLGTNGGSILRIEKGNLEVVTPASPQIGRIVGFLSLGTKGILVVTAYNGLYILSGGALTPASQWTEVSDFLKQNQAFSAARSNNLYAFGTVNDGAVVVDAQTMQTSYINKQTGLQDNTVLGLGFDFSENLWLCLDNGIGYAMIDSSVFNLLGSSSDSGAGYASMLKGNTLYLATNRGLFETQYPFAGKVTPPQLRRTHSGQVWGLDSVGSDIFMSADDGLFLLPGAGEPMKIDGIPEGSWYVSRLEKYPGKALASTYTGFYLLEKEGGRWVSRGKIEGYDDAGGKFVEDLDGTIWLAHWIKGIYRLKLAPDLRRFSEVKLYTAADGLPNERDNSLAIYNGKLRIATASGEFFIPEKNGRLVKDENLSNLIPLRLPAHFYSLPSGVSFAFSPKLVWKMTRDSQGHMQVDSVSLKRVASSLIPGFEHVGFLDDNTMLVSHQEGFYSINLSDHPAGKWKNGVFVESLLSGDSILFEGLPRGAEPKLKLPYKHNSLTFNFAAPEYRYENGVLFSYMLEGYDRDWSTPSELTSKEYTGLKEGKYVMKVRSLNVVTGETAESELPFEILPPWYRSAWAWAVYIILIIAGLIGVYFLLKYIADRKARKIRAQKEAEMELLRREAEKEALKKDYEIAALKSDQLELDVKHKSSELSNTAMNVIRKNEILLDISGMLNKLHERVAAEGTASPRLKKELDKIQAMIHENISHDDDWKKFNQNFDIVYADFTKHLAELHPGLSLSERRLCCYLRMGLSSKEIAPIFNISPKSVEMNRYRLRRKMGLEREDNLVEYLQKI